MKKIVIPYSQSIHWPKKCAYCCSPADEYSKLDHAETTAHFVFVYNERKTQLNFPICKNHRMRAAINNFPTKFNLKSGAMLLFLIPFAIGFLIILGVNQLVTFEEFSSTKKIVSEVVMFGTYMISIGLLLYAYISNPVKIGKTNKNEFILKLKNSEFADEFDKLNNATVRSRSVDKTSNPSS